MTKKRFEITENNVVFDYKYGEPISQEKVVEILNDLLRQNQRLFKENVQLKKELQRIYDVGTINKAINVLEARYDRMLSDGSSEIKDAMRMIVLKCIEDLDEFKDDITAR